ncbi:aminotransferase class IV [Halobacillus salinarum]|uniref:aminotransferase class IV n=1 Tax=Halobacillus salinarum TaxID=2932257 RepID=UPI002962148F|nr:aminotransferase class IV [Halobacillus salinarum]
MLEFHVKRARDSSRYFQRPFFEGEILKKLQAESEAHPKGLFKVRLLLDKTGASTIETTKIQGLREQINGKLALSPVDENNPFLFHKTTHREIYNEHSHAAGFAVLLWNSKKELTEFTIANLVVKQQGEYYTPPVSSGLLAGTFRACLLKEAKVKEKVLLKKDLSTFEEIWMVNGLRGWVKVFLT